MCFILHHWLSQVPLSSWPRWEILVILCPITKECNCSCPCSPWTAAEAWGAGAEEWNSLAELCGKTSSVWLLACFTMRNLVAHLQKARIWVAVCLCVRVCCSLPGGGTEMFCVSPDSAPRLRNSPWPLTLGLPDKTHAYSDMRLGVGPLAGGRVLHHY